MQDDGEERRGSERMVNRPPSYGRGGKRAGSGDSKLGRQGLYTPPVLRLFYAPAINGLKIAIFGRPDAS